MSESDRSEPVDPDGGSEPAATRIRSGFAGRAVGAVGRHPWRSIAVTLVLGLSVVVGSWAWIAWSTRGAVSDVARAPEAPVAIILGAGLRPDGAPSPWLTNRLAQGAALYRAGKVQVLLVSGDNSRGDYDEVTAMADWLVASGVPAERVVRDHAGFDTWDSCARAKRIFGVDRALVVTQDFHVPRAVYLCRKAGIDTYGVAASSAGASTAPNQVREALAAVKAVADGLTRPDPHHLGPAEPGVERALASEED